MKRIMYFFIIILLLCLSSCEIALGSRRPFKLPDEYPNTNWKSKCEDYEISFKVNEKLSAFGTIKKNDIIKYYYIECNVEYINFYYTDENYDFIMDDDSIMPFENLLYRSKWNGRNLQGFSFLVKKHKNNEYNTEINRFDLEKAFNLEKTKNEKMTFIFRQI